MTEKDLQNELDIKKWLDSEKENMDLCGTYDFCKGCNKEIEFPCAKAYQVKNKTKRIVLTFSEKLENAKETTIDKYEELVDYIKSLKASSRVTKKYHNFRYKKQLIVRISLTRNSLKVHLPLDPKKRKYDSITHLDMSDKKSYVDVPFGISLSSKKAMKNAKELINQVIESIK